MSHGIIPAGRWRLARRCTQAAVLLAVVFAPLLGGWQRLDRNNLAGWDGHGWDLPGPLMQALPVQDAPTVYAANRLLGGGASTSLLDVPALDPVAGLLALGHGSGATGLFWLAWLLPLLLSFIAGRVFCGWFCPFGALARFGDRLFERLPWRPRPVRLPRRRPLRWILLLGTVAAGFLVTEWLLYLFLPHVMLQMSAYAWWLMGGGGAVFGWLVGLMLAGLVFGPNAYCSTLCPTGAALSLGGRVRAVRIAIAAPDACGRCNLCTRACWLQLDPASGDPGADCDVCTRCFAACPRDNLRVGLSAKLPRRLRAGTGQLPLLLALGIGLAAAAGTARAAPSIQPRLLLDARTTQGPTEIAAAAVDYGGVRLDADDRRAEIGVDISLFVAAGPLTDPDARGRIAGREVYRGPLVFTVHAADGAVLHRGRFAAPTAPRSAPDKSLYRARIDIDLSPDCVLEVEPVAGWFERPARFVVPDPNPGKRLARIPLAMFAGLLVFGGLLAIACVWPPKPAG